jgi:hypothetical protein
LSPHMRDVCTSRDANGNVRVGERQASNHAQGGLNA